MRLSDWLTYNLTGVTDMKWPYGNITFGQGTVETFV